MSNINNIASISSHQYLPFSTTKFHFRPSLHLNRDDKQLTILVSIDIKTKTLITNKLQATNNKSKERRRLPIISSPITSLFVTLYSFSQKLLHINAKSEDAIGNSSHVLGGNFASVDELEPTNCEVIEGQLPLALNGVYIRNGPNLRSQPRHFLDLFFGDGMLHCLQLSNGNARYCSRYVKTHKYMLERDVDFPIVPSGTSLDKLDDILSFLRAVVMGHLDPMKGFGVANTSVAFFASKLFALCEYDLPYVINLTENGDIETLGRWEFDKNPKLLASMTAHPKLDAETKETFAFRWSLTFPHLIFFRFDENGVKQKEVPIFSVKQPSFIHDFAITKRFAIFHETQLVIAPMEVVMRRGTLIDYERRKVPRIGVMPRNALNDSEIKWFEIRGFNAIHVLNAWENGEDEIVIVASNIVPLENIFDDNVKIILEKVVINMETGKISRTILSQKNLEYGSINPGYIGKKSRFGYLGVNEELVMKMSGVVKIDLETGCEVGRRSYEPRCFGGEPLFVPRDSNDMKSEEDDGFLMCYVHDEETKESKFMVMDAKSPSLDVVAMVKLPRRVPYGFHGFFLSN